MTVKLVRQLLVDAGFEIFRARGDEISLAERPRENLIMDSGVRLGLGPRWEVRLVLRAQKTDFPAEEESSLFARVRTLGLTALANGYREVDARVSIIDDPGGSDRTLDTLYEIIYAKEVAGIEEAVPELRKALATEKRG